MEGGMYIICVTSTSGLPVFTRSVGHVKQLPFPVIGSLNAVHMFAANHGAQLHSTSTQDAKIVWKEYHQSLMLIAVVCGGLQHDTKDGQRSSEPCDDPNELLAETAPPDPSTSACERLLDNVWDALVLLCGQEEVTNIRSVERFKKEVKVCFPVIDTLMSRDLPLFCDVTSAVDGLLVPESWGMQNVLETFVESCGSPYGCLCVHGRVVVATVQWWGLHPCERVLLSLLCHSLLPCSSRDLPVYLPYLSPNVPHRLLTFTLTPHVDVMMICGPTPSLAQVEQDVGRFWVPAVQSLHSVRKLHPRNFPTQINLDLNIQGLLLVNTSSNQSVSSVDVSREGREGSEARRRRRLLRRFYNYVREEWLKEEAGDDELSESVHTATDAYTTHTDHKCYAHSHNSHQLYLLFSSKIPTYAMRSVTQKTLAAFIKDKSILI